MVRSKHHAQLARFADAGELHPGLLKNPRLYALCRVSSSPLLDLAWALSDLFAMAICNFFHVLANPFCVLAQVGGILLKPMAGTDIRTLLTSQHEGAGKAVNDISEVVHSNIVPRRPKFKNPASLLRALEPRTRKLPKPLWPTWGGTTGLLLYERRNGVA